MVSSSSLYSALLWCFTVLYVPVAVLLSSLARQNREINESKFELKPYDLMTMSDFGIFESYSHQLAMAKEVYLSRRTSRHEFLKTPQIHLPFQQGNDIRVECLPVRVIQVALLGGFVEIAFDDGEVLRVVDGLHDEPGESLLVLGVDGRSLEELGV